RGAFGACLMREPALVGDCLAAMRDACSLPVTVKHRIGVDRDESFAFVRDFVGTVHRRGGCSVFIVHARNAWLQGLSPKENREIPPLRHELVHRLKRDFPALTIVVNGGLAGDEALAAQLPHVDGAMVGRHAYHEPWSMAGWDTRFLGADAPAASSREAVEEAFVAYLEGLAGQGTPWSHASRHMLGLYNGQPGARRWRQVWSDHRLKGERPTAVMRQARAAMAQGSRLAQPLASRRSLTSAA
ncbi:MAG: tRNA dihydrouridine(20/20a) synthase DusA, partial [Rubrivivax sp.]